ncbi:glycoside hydrolase family 61 protein [Thermothelomyces thermophilus ATCC 42464]|uniref:lytic cellulose monooxygenase (C4-dehydrogenating) n=1 Tax=Thermothelomyces thermophilus (strain ATCC 42464 / BCRC 31852 / DSM 1799) TaxID=573729 RepID=G2QNY4_THET4|nr:glycoside hydrolase family 61 protein [Thermothelomyces thermophilus ATCC 42464]AEO61305.1 glycoside hydrolase family 61 protein [Thermothelomyces thermophilus ATCC 42464]
MRLLASLLLAATAVQAHYTFPRLVVNGQPEESDWSATRMTKNAQSKQGVENPTSGDIRCYTSQTAANVVTVPAGSTIHYISTQQINHPGPTQYYLAKVPPGSSAKTFDGSGAVWFKISTTMPTVDSNKQMFWPGQNTYETSNTTIPANTPDGEYLLRVKQIALHMASQPNKVQFYLACTQIKITGGRNGTPSPLVALPGAYKSTDPGILVDIYSMKPESYQPPGPPVWRG